MWYFFSTKNVDQSCLKCRQKWGGQFEGRYDFDVFRPIFVDKSSNVLFQHWRKAKSTKMLFESRKISLIISYTCYLSPSNQFLLSQQILDLYITFVKLPYNISREILYEIYSFQRSIKCFIFGQFFRLFSIRLIREYIR